MRKGLTEVVFILDRSGSMRGLEADTIGGFNSMVEKQRKEEGEALVSVVLFDDQVEIPYDRVPVDKVETMTDSQYYVRGCTALLDAIGGAVHHIAKLHKNLPENEVPEKTLFIITTDGMENASRRYGAQQVKDMIQRQKERYGWEFLFLAANIDAVEAAEHIGISRSRAANYRADEAGTERMFGAMSKAVSAMRCRAPMADNWAEELEQDAKRR